MSELSTYLNGQEEELQQTLGSQELSSEVVSFSSDSIIYEPDGPADWFYRVEEGQVRLVQLGPQNAARLAAILGPGDWFGVSTISGHENYGSRAIAVGNVAVRRIARERLQQRLGKLPSFEISLILYLARRMQIAQREAAYLVFDDCNRRLLKKLIEFSQSSAATPGEGGVVLRITHEQLAQAVGAARETVSLALTQLRQRNLLRTGRNSLSFDPQVLRELLERGDPSISATC